MSERNLNSAELLTLDELKEKASTVYSEGLGRISLLAELSAGNLIQLESHGLLQKAIIGNQDVDIAALIERLGNSDWVKQGLKYHEQDPETCPFCQQSTDDHFADSLKSFFSDAYDNDIQAIRELQSNYQRAGEQLMATIQRNVELDNPFLNQELFNAEAQALSERLKGNRALLDDKFTEPSRKIGLGSVEPLLVNLQKTVSEVNDATTSHNETVANIATERQTLTAQVWRYVLNELADDVSEYQKKRFFVTSRGFGLIE